MVNIDIINNIKSLMRIAEDDDSFNGEVEDLVMQCHDDLSAAGIPESFLDIVNNDFLSLDGNIRICIVLYVKAYFGIGDITDSGWFAKQYNYKKGMIMNQQKYNGDTV